MIFGAGLLFVCVAFGFFRFVLFFFFFFSFFFFSQVAWTQPSGQTPCNLIFLSNSIFFFFGCLGVSHRSRGFYFFSPVFIELFGLWFDSLAFGSIWIV